MPASSSGYDRCPRCKQWAWLKNHRCPPAWSATTDSGHETKVLAESAQEAAEKAVEHWERDWCEGRVAGGCEVMEVTVTGEDGEAKKFEVSGDLIPHYHAREIKETKAHAGRV